MGWKVSATRRHVFLPWASWHTFQPGGPMVSPWGALPSDFIRPNNIIMRTSGVDSRSPPQQEIAGGHRLLLLDGHQLRFLCCGGRARVPSSRTLRLWRL